jgi:hypothetical protein
MMLAGIAAHVVSAGEHHFGEPVQASGIPDPASSLTKARKGLGFNVGSPFRPLRRSISHPELTHQECAGGDKMSGMRGHGVSQPLLRPFMKMPGQVAAAGAAKVGASAAFVSPSGVGIDMH